MEKARRTKWRLLIIPILVFFATLACEKDINKKANGESVKLKPVIQEFKDMIDGDPIVRMHFTRMIDEVPVYYKHNPEPGVYLESIDQMLYLINDAIGKGPEYNETDLVGFPINSILNWTMNVPAGFAAFRNEKVNSAFRKILSVYKDFLNSEASLDVLNDGPTGWKSKAAMAKLDMSQYKYDPDDKYWGFKSWNDFFTRQFKDCMRPIAGPGNGNVIAGACDSQVFAIKHDVKRSDWFWIKSQPYSLKDMLDGDELVDRFVGGDVYQAFLSALKYHRWHSPVSGTIVKTKLVQGTYYSGVESQGTDPGSPNYSQGYISHVATRAIIFIEADDPVGLMCVMPVGMAEVSSCVIDEKIKPGYKIKKGEELGYFQFGGSTYCLIFRPGVIKEFEVKAGDDVKVGQKIAVAK